MKTVLYVVADTNDADYLTSEYSINEEELRIVEKIASALNKTGHNWVTSEYARDGESPEEMYGNILTSEEIELFNDYVPYGEYGIHTIVQMELRRVEVLEKFI